MCVKAVDDFRPISKFVPDWFVTNEIIKKLYIALFPDDYILFFEEDSGNVTFSSNEICILSVDFNINLLAWHNRLKQCKVFKNCCSMASGWWDCWMLEDQKNEIKSFFIDEK